MDRFEKRAHISRRMIGDVNIFDLSGEIKDEEIGEVASYLKAYAHNIPMSYVIINCENLEACDFDKLEEVFRSLQPVKKSSLYIKNNRIRDLLENEEMQNQFEICKDVEEVVREFGPMLRNTGKGPVDKRIDRRFTSAISTQLQFKNGADELVLENHGIITNISQSGIYVEYLELLPSKKLAELNCFKDLLVYVSTKNDLGGKNDFKGRIVRTELSGNQMALAIHFDEKLNL